LLITQGGGGVDLGIKLTRDSIALWLAALPTACMIHLRRTLWGGIMQGQEAAGLITQIHRQMGRPLAGKSNCIIEKETA
ncbi:MAG: hypothetical protein LBR23_01680, partial [Spirochaetaceae bacterium]|nr:hypothetical protein [Spirochaetaceae bacterium]